MTAPLALLLLAGLQAAPAAQTSDVAVLLTRRVDLPRTTAGDIVQAVAAAVEAEKVGVLPAAKLKAAKLAEPDTCAGKKDCVLALGKKLGVAVVVGVQVGSVASSSAPIALYVGALRVSDGASLADLSAEVQRDKLKAIDGVGEFARRLREALAAPAAVAATTPEPKAEPKPEPAATTTAPEHKPATTQPATTTTTTTETTKVVLAIPPPPPPIETGVPPEALGTHREAGVPSHSAGYAMVGVAAVTAAAAVGCLIAGMVLKKDLDGYDVGGVHKVDLTRAEADRRVRTVNILLTTSLVTGIVAAGSGTTAAIVW
ncbi:MAG TPA: hypothetical protein VGK67_34030 [Myxococcales bacterium]|jgi:hypothetical protein